MRISDWIADVCSSDLRCASTGRWRCPMAGTCRSSEPSATDQQGRNATTTRGGNVYPGVHAQSTPDKPALIMGGSGEVVTYRQLDERSNQLARLWRDHGLAPGDHVAIFSENNARFLEVMWAALRSGLYITTVNKIGRAHV